MAYKLLALDMDGTLLDEDKRVSEPNRLWIRRASEAGITVCIATGRGKPDIVPYLTELELRTPFTAVNGSEVWKDADTLKSRHLLELEDLKKLHGLAIEYDTWYWAFGASGKYDKSNWITDIDAEQWMKYCYYTENEQILASLTERIGTAGLKLEMTNSHPKNIELNPQGISKATGLKEICTLIGCRMDEVVAVGDSMNDLSMIREAGLGVAMGNAQEAVKDAADAIAPSNNDHGVAEVIRRYILKDFG